MSRSGPMLAPRMRVANGSANNSHHIHSEIHSERGSAILSRNRQRQAPTRRITLPCNGFRNRRYSGSVHRQASAIHTGSDRPSCARHHPAADARAATGRRHSPAALRLPRQPQPARGASAARARLGSDDRALHRCRRRRDPGRDGRGDVGSGRCCWRRRSARRRRPGLRRGSEWDESEILLDRARQWAAEPRTRMLDDLIAAERFASHGRRGRHCIERV
jgi:hypothetical protein